MQRLTGNYEYTKEHNQTGDDEHITNYREYQQDRVTEN